MLERLSNLRVILVRPRFPENIGAAARAVANMGLGGLTLVSPQRLDPTPMKRLASHHGDKVLEAMIVTDTLSQALSSCAAAVATTARVGRNRGRLASPRRIAPQVLEWAGKGQVGVVFGPEDRGLTTAELDACFWSVCIPTTGDASLNLAQAVVVMAYELRCAAMEAHNQGKASTGTPPKTASMGELDSLKSHLKQALIALSVLPADNPDHFFRPFKAVLERAGLTAREVRAWRGLGRQALWAAGRAKQKGGDKA